MADKREYGPLISPELQAAFVVDCQRILSGLIQAHFARVEEELGHMMADKDTQIENLTEKVLRLEKRVQQFNSRGKY